MTQKHFIAIAAIFRDRVEAHRADPAELYALGNMASDLADYFASINPNFKRDRFMSACGFGD